MQHQHSCQVINTTPEADGIDDGIFLEGRCTICKKLLFTVEESISTTYVEPVDLEWCKQNPDWLK